MSARFFLKDDNDYLQCIERCYYNNYKTKKLTW